MRMWSIYRYIPRSNKIMLLTRLLLSSWRRVAVTRTHPQFFPQVSSINFCRALAPVLPSLYRHMCWILFITTVGEASKNSHGAVEVVGPSVIHHFAAAETKTARLVLGEAHRSGRFVRKKRRQRRRRRHTVYLEKYVLLIVLNAWKKIYAISPWITHVHMNVPPPRRPQRMSVLPSMPVCRVAENSNNRVLLLTNVR